MRIIFIVGDFCFVKLYVWSMEMKKKALVLLSGGLDSATAAAIAENEGFELAAMTFRYGQRHEVEISSAKELAAYFKIEKHIIIDIPTEIFRSALTSSQPGAVPRNREINTDEIPDTYVPARNILFLTYALAYCESMGASDIFIGANAVDYSGYPDCRPEFFVKFEEMAKAGTKMGVQGIPFYIHTPLLEMTKSEIILRGTELGIDYFMTHSCYDPDPDGASCGECDSCILRRKGFLDAGIPDPTRYRKS